MRDVAWTTVEFYKHEKGGWWYAILWLLALALVVAAFLTENFLVVGLVIVAALVLTLYAAKEPEKLKVGLDDEALYINEKRFPLPEFSSFWIMDRGDHYILSLHRTGPLRTDLRLIMPPSYAGNVRMLMRPSVPEEEHEESLIDILAERLKF